MGRLKKTGTLEGGNGPRGQQEIATRGGKKLWLISLAAWPGIPCSMWLIGQVQKGEEGGFVRLKSARNGSPATKRGEGKWILQAKERLTVKKGSIARYVHRGREYGSSRLCTRMSQFSLILAELKDGPKKDENSSFKGYQKRKDRCLRPVT